ncbi:MAG: hypothetical protein JXA15_06140 [Spirochaetales bacterium]|nr:hypothetical protein [Spirochaetales bacterium]
MQSTGQYPPFSRRGRPVPRRRSFRPGFAALAAVLLGVALAGCERPVVAVVLDPLIAVASPSAAAALSGFTMPGARTRVSTLDARSPDAAAAVFDSVVALASPLALRFLAELPPELLPPSVMAVDAPVPRELADRTRVASFDRSAAWKAAGALFGELSAIEDGGIAAVLLVEGPARPAARADDFALSYRSVTGRDATKSVLPADASQAAFDSAISGLLRLDLRFAVVAAGARTPEAVRRLAAAGIVVAADSALADAALVLEDDWTAALERLAAGDDAPVLPSRLARGPAFAAAAARFPALAEAADGFPRAR